jgi:hypothetical protein
VSFAIKTVGHNSVASRITQKTRHITPGRHALAVREPGDRAILRAHRGIPLPIPKSGFFCQHDSKTLVLRRGSL